MAQAAPTKFCKVNESSCLATESHVYGSGTVLKAATAVGAPAKITVPKLGEVECAASFEGKTTAESGEPLPGEISAFSWTSCQVIGKNRRAP